MSQTLPHAQYITFLWNGTYRPAFTFSEDKRRSRRNRHKNNRK